MYIGHGRLCVSLCVCVSVPRRIPTLLHEPGCNLRNSTGFPLVVHYWADLQSVHGFRCCGNIARTRNVSECFYSLWLSLVAVSCAVGGPPIAAFNSRGNVPLWNRKLAWNRSARKIDCLWCNDMSVQYYFSVVCHMFYAL